MRWTEGQFLSQPTISGTLRLECPPPSTYTPPGTIKGLHKVKAGANKAMFLAIC